MSFTVEDLLQQVNRLTHDLTLERAEKALRLKELMIANKEKAKKAAELIVAYEQLQSQNIEKEHRVVNLLIANEEKAKRTAELVLANEELKFQNEEKAKRAAELLIANEELAYQTQEKSKRVAELVLANEEKAKRSSELLIANEEKVKRVAELLIAKLQVANNDKLKLSLMETIEIAMQLVELRDPYTAGHEKQVGNLAKAIAAEMGLNEEHQKGLMIAGYLHDMGKIIIPVEILCKPGKISAEEYNLVKNHVQAGYELLKNVSFPWPIAQPVSEHHERLDGSGYPNHKKGDEISLDGRILAVADVVDAICSHRPYRAALGVEAALDEIQKGRGRLYDGAVVDACRILFIEKNYKNKSNNPLNTLALAVATSKITSL